MPRARGYILQHRRFFVACEGESEVGYAALLQQLARDSGLSVHLDIRRCHGGDPLAIVETAVSELKLRSRQRGAFMGQAIFLDADRRDDVPDRTGRADRLILEHGFTAIWSEPAFEVLLLKHLDGCERLQPATSALALQQLQNHWRGYRKGMTAGNLRARLDRGSVERAASVLTGLREFLVEIQLLT